MSATLDAGFAAARRLIRRLEVPNRTVQQWAARELSEADRRVQEKIDRGFLVHLDDSEPACETEAGR